MDQRSWAIAGGDASTTHCRSRRDGGATRRFGRVRRSLVVGDVTVVCFSTWIRIATIATCPVVFWVGIRLPRKWFSWKLVMLVLPIAGATIVAPGLFSDRVEIDGRGFRLQTGFWWAPTCQEVRFTDAVRTWVPHAETSPRDRTPIVVQLRSGRVESVPQGDLMTQCLEDIANATRQAGVRVERNE